MAAVSCNVLESFTSLPKVEYPRLMAPQVINLDEEYSVVTAPEQSIPSDFASYCNGSFEYSEMSRRGIR